MLIECPYTALLIEHRAPCKFIGAARARMRVTCLTSTSNNGDEALAHVPVYIVVLLVHLEVICVQRHGVSLAGAKGQLGPVQGNMYLCNPLLCSGSKASDSVLSQNISFQRTKLACLLTSIAWTLMKELIHADFTACAIFSE